MTLPQPGPCGASWGQTAQDSVQGMGWGFLIPFFPRGLSPWIAGLDRPCCSCRSREQRPRKRATHGCTGAGGGRGAAGLRSSSLQGSTEKDAMRVAGGDEGWAGDSA